MNVHPVMTNITDTSREFDTRRECKPTAKRAAIILIDDEQ